MKYRLSDLTIDTGRQLVSRATDPIPLPRLSYDLLLVLVQAAPNVVSQEELMRLVWPGIVVSPETVSQRVKLLRDALDDDPRAPITLPVCEDGGTSWPLRPKRSAKSRSQFCPLLT
ncbi:MAG: winged helix-turn-helix domain-containing protein [Steroidobacteraceae bacterium]